MPGILEKKKLTSLLKGCMAAMKNLRLNERPKKISAKTACVFDCLVLL